METIKVQNNDFQFKQLADTQEDNFGGIRRKFELHLSGELVGRLYEYGSGNVAVFHGFIRYDFTKDQITLPDIFA